MCLTSLNKVISIIYIIINYYYYLIIIIIIIITVIINYFIIMATISYKKGSRDYWFQLGIS